MTRPKTFINARKTIIFITWRVDGAALVEIASPNLHVTAKCLCEFAIPYMEASVKTHRPKQSLKGIAFHCDNAPSQTAK
jgi:hypothetical protein